MKFHAMHSLVAAGTLAAQRLLSTGVFSAEKARAQSSALTVAVSPATIESLPNTLTATGNVGAWRELISGTEAGWRGVSEVLVDEGDRGLTGQVIDRVDRRRSEAIEAELLGLKVGQAEARIG
jgi:multidrug efflux pump subunit AcrA (membrane-fusion protein)